MARKTEQWWASGAKPGVRRCSAMKRSGGQCLREAERGSVVCGTHGGLAPQVQRRAKERVAIAADAIVQQMLAWFHDPDVPLAIKVKIAQDFLDRSSVDRTAKVVVGVDPFETMFRSLLERDDALEPEHEPLALPVSYDGPDEDGAYTGAIIGQPDYWEGPPIEPEPDVI